MVTRDQLGEDTEPTPAEVLRRPQEFEPAGSFEVRDVLLDYLVRDLLGPWGEPDEVIERDHPRGRYLVGQLGPKELLPRETAREEDDPANDPDELDDGESLNAGTEDAELPTRISTADIGRLEASSMGVSFKVASETETVHVTAEWGQYLKTANPDPEKQPGRVWKRVPHTARKEVPLTEGSQRFPLTSSDGERCVMLRVQTRVHADCKTVEVSLVNAQREPQQNADEAWLFQPRLTIRALDGVSAVFLPMDDPLHQDAPPTEFEDPEEMRLRLLYRSRLQYARGRNVAVQADADKEARRATLLRTEWMPVTDVPGTSAPTAAQQRLLEGLELSMTALAEADIEALRSGLAPLSAGYRSWLGEQQDRIPSLPVQLREPAKEALAEAFTIADRIGEGIRLLTDPALPLHGPSLRAFRFAQRAMAAQRIHTQTAAHRADHGTDYPTALAAIEGEGADAASWRPFQLAFLILNIASLADPAHPDRAATSSGLVDLLFFPTGGGKTEAYLGLAAFTMAIRRLQGVTGSGTEARDAASGIAVFMRYTLRLLTSQQFQRASALVCAAELLRREEPAVFGAEPFRIGLWVGMKVTPNTYDDAAEDIEDMKSSGKIADSKTLQLESCPWCGEQFEPNAIETDGDRRRVLLYCPRSGGPDRCPFSRPASPAEGLPVVSVDEEIYRLLPAFVVATVDKLAQLPWKGEAGMLFGLTESRCPRHGYRHPDLDDRTGCRGKHRAVRDLPATSSEPIVRPRPWDLIIQDELHLISGALGTSVALFESAVDYLLQWELEDGRSVGPKIVASTATTKRSAAQVKGIYNRKVAIFPPPVLDIEDTFFSKQDPVEKETPGRRYLGLCAHGVRLKQAEIRLWDTLLVTGQTLFDRFGPPADPYMTPVGYFNATRELAGMRRYLDDDVSIRVRRRRDGFSPRLGSRQTLKITELTSRVASSDIASTLSDLEKSFDPERDTTVRRVAIGREIAAARKERRELDPLAEELSKRPKRTGAVLATSMLQVGVDVSRFGLMVVTGQPKNTAEYIQASSRVGRDAKRPGLVVTLYNWTRPRDLDHFEDFHYYHDTYYRQVEALSVTPFTRRALDRGATGALVAAIRQRTLDASANSGADRFDADTDLVADATETMIERAQEVKGGEAADYLRERSNVLFDEWRKEQRRGNLVYRPGSGKDNRAGLLRAADGTEWTPLTVANSMRETEGEAKLIFPEDDTLFMPELDAPDWSYGPTAATSGGA